VLNVKTIGHETTWLPLSSLGKWNAACQRDVTSLQNTIAKNFDERAFGVLHVLRRKGKYMIIDGQNRAAALKILGYNGSHQVPCIDHGEITDAEAAAIFQDVNTFKGLQAYNIFMSAFMRGEADQYTIMEIVKNEGLTISPGGHSGAISAVRALERVHRPHPKGEPDAAALHRTLHTIVQAWGKDRHALHGAIISGVGQVYIRDKDRVNDDEMVSKLARRAGGPSKLIGDARGVHSLIGGSIPACIADLIIQEYNRGRRASDRMLKPFRA
jgi:hypothetical protein